VGCPIHVTNRGNDRRQLFFKDADFSGFIDLLAEGALRFSIELLGYCILPNHFHLLVCQREPGAVSAYIHRFSGISARAFRESTGTVGLGHVYQRRFWSRVVGHESDYLVALRYVEANPLRAQLVSRAEDWQWGSLWERLTGRRQVLAPLLVVLPPTWREIVNEVQPREELESFRAPVKLGRPRAKPTAR
jgi:putative transposase